MLIKKRGLSVYNSFVVELDNILAQCEIELSGDQSNLFLTMSASKEIENPNEHLAIPEWITEEYFQSVLDKDEPDHVKVLKFTPVAAIPPGGNFTSVMLRIYIDLELKGNYSFECASIPTNLDKTYNLFQMEVLRERPISLRPCFRMTREVMKLKVMVYFQRK